MKHDGREIARQNELRVLKALHKFGWLRTRDLAALLWVKVKTHIKQGFMPVILSVDATALRMAQRTLARLRRDRKVIFTGAPDGSMIYGLAEAGARQLTTLAIPAKSGKDLVRRVSLSHYHHRRLANEIAILAVLQGFRVATETEISCGQWFGGQCGIEGKKPDVVVRDGKRIWWVEVERSRRNKKDYQRLLAWLMMMWSSSQRPGDPANLPGGYILEKVLFVCENAFVERLITDLRKAGLSDVEIEQRIVGVRLLYVSEAKFLLKAKPSAGANGVRSGG
ncbi:MAG: replication-relaxation family protein [Pseudomonadota bacterium]